MPVLPSARPDELPGDHLARKARRTALYALILTPTAFAVFWWLPTIWNPIQGMTGPALYLASMALGAALAAFPVLAAVTWLLALYWAVEARHAPRQQPAATDRLILALGMLVSYAPGVGFYITVVHALMTGRVHFSNPPRDYYLDSDPAAYWEGVGFMAMAGTVLVFMVTRYWQAKRRQRHALSTTPNA